MTAATFPAEMAGDPSTLPVDPVTKALELAGPALGFIARVDFGLSQGLMQLGQRRSAA